MTALLNRRLFSVAAIGGLAACATAAPPVAALLAEGLKPLSPLLGRWRGRGEGDPGVSTVERTYAVALGGKFIEARNRSTYAAQPANPGGETHDDLGYYGFDRARRRVLFRQFHVEGFVLQYLATAAASLDGPFVMEAEAIENVPAGFRARETLTLTDDRLEEVFEVAESGKAFAVYSRNVLTRA